MANITLNVYLDKKCAECGKGGATDGPLCLACITKAIQGKPFKTEIGRTAAERVKDALRGHHR